VCLGAAFGVVEHRPQTELRLQAAEHGFHIGEHGIGTPQRCVIPGDFVAAQAVDARVGQLGPLDRGLFAVSVSLAGAKLPKRCPGDGGSIQPRVIGDDGDLVMLGVDPIGWTGIGVT